MNIIESIKENYILIFVTISLFYLIHKNNTNNNLIEKMENEKKEELNSKIRNVYQADIESLRNLSSISKKLLDDGILVSGDLTINGKLIAKNKMTVDKNLDSKQKFNYLPKGIIIPFNGSVAPSGWAICNGTKGTPDLRGRFILSSGQGTGLTNRNLNDKSGTEKVTLTSAQIPKHKHNYQYHYFCSSVHNNHNWDGWIKHRSNAFRDHTGYWEFKLGTHNRNTSAIGGGQSHENMPPFYVLTYIMKL